MTTPQHKFLVAPLISTWNKLPASVVEVSSVNSFKKRQDDYSKDVDCGTISDAYIHYY